VEIISITREGRHELQLTGRLDANWADHVASAIELAIHNGQHRIDIDMALVDYISSMGVGVLVRFHKQLSSIKGILRVVNPHENVLRVLTIVKVADMLVATKDTSGWTAPDTPTRRWERNGIILESQEQLDGRGLEGRLLGHPEKFATGQLSTAEGCRTRFGDDVFGLGLGAFGSSAAECSKRIGEFLAAGGAAITQPTDGSSVPDFQVVEGQLVPELHVLYGMTADGQFSQLLRFEASTSERGVIALAELVEAALEELQSSCAGFVIVAETTSIVGATLRQSPVLANGQSPWDFPAVRDWISFTAEPTNERNLALIVGIADREPPAEIAAFVHPIGKGTNAQGHFHSAVFPYRPLPKGNLNLQKTITSLLETRSAQTVMHLLADDREFEGVGQTELVRGACWVGPLRILKHAPSMSLAK
jgi:anti-anti-sigma factor